jgi:hypothetical protein
MLVSTVVTSADPNTYGVWVQSSTDPQFATKTLVGYGTKPNFSFRAPANNVYGGPPLKFDYTITTCDSHGAPLPGTGTFYIQVNPPGY